MTVKKEEFLTLKQGSSSVSEYRDRFLQLSRYAPEDVNTDAKRQYRFLRGLVDPLHYQLMNHTFPTLQHLIDRAIMTERKLRRWRIVSARSVDPSLEAAAALVSQATNLSSSGRTSVHLSIVSSSKGSTLSTSIRTVRAISQEVSFRGRISRHLVFLPQQASRTIRQHQLRLETEHVSTVESKATG
jgi:galactokinase/mevalonate kinase-like predicted kinase